MKVRSGTEAAAVLGFFCQLPLSKSQADALLRTPLPTGYNGPVPVNQSSAWRLLNRTKNILVLATSV